MGQLPRLYLTGNGRPCPACDGTGRGRPLDRITYSGGGVTQFYERCSTCAGLGRVPVDRDNARF